MREQRAPEQRTIDVDVESIDTRGRTLHGYAAVYNVESGDLGGFRERIAPGAFQGVLDADVRALLNHDPNAVLGRSKAGTLRLHDEQRGLRFEVDLPDSPIGENVRAAVGRGDIDGASFRFIVGDEEWDGDLRTVRTVKELQDVTVATYGAYPAASVELRTRPEKTENEPAEKREKENTMDTEDRQTGGGGLAVEDRQASTERRSIEERLVDWMRSVPRGESRALSTSVATSNAEQATQVFDRLRAASVGLRSGFRVLASDSDSVVFPAITADASPAWYSEAAVIAAGDPTLSTVTATPRKLAHRVEFSNEVIDDSDPDIVDLVRQHLLAVLGVRLDYFLFYGSGTAPEIRGLVNVSGTQTVAAVGTPANLDGFATALYNLEAENVPGPYAIATHPRTWQTLRKLKEATGSNKPLLADPPSQDAPGSIYGVPVHLTSQLPTNEGAGTNETTAFVYAPNEVIVVRRQDVEVELDRSRLFDKDSSELRAKLRIDVVVPNPKSIVKLTGITAA